MIGGTRWRFPEVDSTQNVAFALAGMGADSGTIVRTEYQRSGRGRLGRRWDVPAATSLMFSVVLRPTHQVHELGSLSLAVADALVRVFTDVAEGDAAVKWPNDILINGRKVSGILVQTRLQPELVAVLGIGINVLQTAAQLPDGATSLALESATPLDRDALFERIVVSLETTLSTWQPELDRRTHADLDQRLWLRGEAVSLRDGDRTIVGTVAGITSTGELRLVIDGQEHRISSGEITRGPRAITTEFQR